jgi:hypothetical protein
MTLPKTTLKMFELGVMPQIKALKLSLPELYSSHYFCQVNVDNFVAEPLQHLVYCFQCFKERGNHCSFWKNGWCLSQ